MAQRKPPKLTTNFATVFDPAGGLSSAETVFRIPLEHREGIRKGRDQARRGEVVDGEELLVRLRSRLR